MAKKKTKRKAAKKPAKAKKKTAKRKTAKGKAKKKTAKRKTAKKKTTKKATKRKAAKGKTKARKTTKRKAKKKTAKKKSSRKPNAAFMAPMQPTPALAAVIGGKAIPRTQVVKKLWQYIKSRNLQDPKNRRNINADEKLLKVFNGRKTVSMFEMTKLVSKQLKKAA